MLSKASALSHGLVVSCSVQLAVNQSFSAILLSTTITSVTYETSPLLGREPRRLSIGYSLADQKPARPIQSSIVLLFILAFSFFSFRTFIARFISPPSASSTNAFQLPLQESPVSNGRKDSNESRPGQFATPKPRSNRKIVISTAIATSFCLLLSALILDNSQCAITSIGVSHLLY